MFILKVNNLIFFFLTKAPKLQWTEVVAELDYATFSIQNKKGMKLLIQGLIKALTNETFPVKHIYKPWKNSEGQVI